MARKLKTKKFYSGNAVDTGDLGSEAANVAANKSAMASVGLGGNNSPVDPGIPTESITNIGDNLKARQRAMGFANVLPGAGVVNVLGAVKDTAVGKKAMGMPLVSGTAQKLKEMSGKGGNENITCPPGYINVGGQCVKKASKGGAMKYYKGLL